MVGKLDRPGERIVWIENAMGAGRHVGEPKLAALVGQRGLLSIRERDLRAGHGMLRGVAENSTG
jgi:hypothetical protein